MFKRSGLKLGFFGRNIARGKTDPWVDTITEDTLLASNLHSIFCDQVAPMASVGNLSYSFDIKTMCDYIAINEAIGYLFTLTTAMLVTK